MKPNEKTKRVEKKVKLHVNWGEIMNLCLRLRK